MPDKHVGTFTCKRQFISLCVCKSALFWWCSWNIRTIYDMHRMMLILVTVWMLNILPM